MNNTTSIRNTNRSRYSSFVIFCFLFLLSLFFRLACLILDPIMMRDSSLYICLADKEIAKGEYLRQLIDRTDINIPPLPIFCIQSLMKSGFGAELSGRFLSIFLGSLIPFLGYCIAKKAFRKQLPALICALILSLHPFLMTYSTQPLRENFYLFFSGVAFIVFLSGIETHRILKWFLCGIFSSLAFFCRYEALEFLIVFPSTYFVYLFIKRTFPKKLFLNVGMFYISFFSFYFFLIHFFGMSNMFLQRIPHFFD